MSSKKEINSIAVCNGIKYSRKYAKKNIIGKSIYSYCCSCDGCSISSILSINFNKKTNNIYFSAYGISVVYNRKNTNIHPRKYQKRTCYNEHGKLQYQKSSRYRSSPAGRINKMRHVDNVMNEYFEYLKIKEGGI